MFKNLMNGVSLSSLMLRAPDDEVGAAEARNKARNDLIKNNTTITVDGKDTPEKKEGEEDGDEDDDEEDDKEDKDKPELDADGNPVVKEEETAEEKTAREAADKVAAKAKRKEDRIQKRINDITTRASTAEAEVARLKAQLEANPEQKLTAEEIETRAKAIADKAQAEREQKEIQDKFEAACDVIQKAAKKADKDFDAKINDIAEQFGPIPSFMIGVLEDFENGGEVLAHIANDEDIAEHIYSLKGRPAKMTKELVEISNKLLEVKKKPKKEISKVPDPVTPVNGNRVAATVITSKDTTPENMHNYVAKRRKQMLERQGR